MELDRSGGASFLGVFERLGLSLKTVFGPLVLDRDSDGYELTNQTSASPRCDIDSDLYRERTAFVKGDDGLRALDLNGDAVIKFNGARFLGSRRRDLREIGEGVRRGLLQTALVRRWRLRREIKRRHVVAKGAEHFERFPSALRRQRRRA